MTGMQVKPKRVFTISIDYIIEAIGAFFPEEGNRLAFHLFLMLLNLLLSSVNIVLFFKLDANNHITFWLGPATRYINLSVPIVLTLVSIHLFLLNCCSFPKDTVRKIIFVVFCVAGLQLVACSIYVLAISLKAHNDLVYACGKSKMTKAVETEWQRLADFQKECAKTEGREENDIFIQQCPGFEEVVNENELMVDYIEDMEYDYGCQGFCQFWSHPLFSEEADTGKRCASLIGADVFDTGFSIGIPTLISGMVTIFIGQVLAQYEHL